MGQELGFRTVFPIGIIVVDLIIGLVAKIDLVDDKLQLESNPVVGVTTFELFLQLDNTLDNKFSGFELDSLMDFCGRIPISKGICDGIICDWLRFDVGIKTLMLPFREIVEAKFFNITDILYLSLVTLRESIFFEVRPGSRE